MLGVLYILLSFVLGYVVCSFAFPKLSVITESTYKGNQLKLSKLFVLIPAWYVIGTVIMTWSTYMLACIFSSNEYPLLAANEIVLSVTAAGCAVGIYLLYRKRKRYLTGTIDNMATYEIVFFFIVTILAYLLFWQTLSVSHNQLYVGLSVYSDFSPHLGMIRSFSYGNNFPTQYSHFAGEDIRYHFMFQFLAGNLEFLGMRIDYALNIPSLLSFVGAVSVLYALAVKLSGRKSAGILSCLFFLFRSSPSLLTYLASFRKGTDIWGELFHEENIEFIGYTEHESWGLWNINVYCNQRHLAFGLIVLLLLIMLYLPQLYEMHDRISESIKRHAASNDRCTILDRIKVFIKESCFTRDGWAVKDIRTAIASGVLLGAIGFFNGAVLIAVVVILFMLAIIADRRLEYLITAVIAGVLALIQTSCFIRGDVISPEFYFGFMAENRTIFGAIDYVLRLTGVFLLLAIFIFAISKNLRRYIMVAFSAPFILAFTVSLTTDIAVNHKYILISIMLLNIFVAILIIMLFKNKNVFVRFICVLLVVAMTATGVYDFTTVMRRNAIHNNLVFNLEDDLTMWIKDNTDSKDIFLTSNYSINNVVLGGAMLYLGWQYYAWSAGYNTVARDRQVKSMYEAKNSLNLVNLTRANKIDYVIIDHDNRVSELYNLNEEIFNKTFMKVFEKGNNEWKITVYDTSKVISE